MSGAEYTNRLALISELVSRKPLPRLHVVSDLHLESGPYALPEGLKFDILVAAGDIGPVEVAVPWLASVGKPVVYVLGNHERWGTEEHPGEDILGAVTKARELAKGTQVHVLERNTVVLQGVRFLGATLWTDLRKLRVDSLHSVWNIMRDYRYITCDEWLADPLRKKRFDRLLKSKKLAPSNKNDAGQTKLHPVIPYLEHQETVRWLKKQLGKAFAGPTVVVSHHAPSFESLRRNGISQGALDTQRWSMRDTEPAKIAAYASELLRTLGSLASPIELWVHGHTHAAFDYCEHGVRVLCNPRGRHQKPLTEADVRGYALFGARLTSEDIARSQALFAENPYRGDTWDFERSLVVDLREGYARPMRLELKQAIARFSELLGELENLLPFTGKGNSVPNRCVDKAFEMLLEEATDILRGKVTDVMRAVDAYAGQHALTTIAVPVGGFLRHRFADDVPLSRADYARAVEDTRRALAWLHAAPELMSVHLLSWREKAAEGLQLLAEAGLAAKVAMLPVRSLRDASQLDLRFSLDEPGALEDGRYSTTREKRAEQLLNEALNRESHRRSWHVSVSKELCGGRRMLSMADLGRSKSTPAESTAKEALEPC